MKPLPHTATVSVYPTVVKVGFPFSVRVQGLDPYQICNLIISTSGGEQWYNPQADMKGDFVMENLFAFWFGPAAAKVQVGTGPHAHIVGTDLFTVE